jgi:hypothetical protein
MLVLHIELRFLENEEELTEDLLHKCGEWFQEAGLKGRMGCSEGKPSIVFATVIPR